MRAVNPPKFPPLPEGAMQWSRSTKRAGGMYHAHTMGMTACGRVIERLHSAGANSLGDMNYWGVCPKCYAKATKAKKE